MENYDEYYTLKGYEINNCNEITSAMEDYLEMIYRIILDNNSVRVGNLSKRLHVKPSSVSKMINHLTERGFINSEKYGYIKMTEKGMLMGEYLLYRHNVIHSFLCKVNGTENETKQAERIEHFFDEKTVKSIDELNTLLENVELWQKKRL